MGKEGQAKLCKTGNAQQCRQQEPAGTNRDKTQSHAPAILVPAGQNLCQTWLGSHMPVFARRKEPPESPCLQQPPLPPSKPPPFRSPSILRPGNSALAAIDPPQHSLLEKANDICCHVILERGIAGNAKPVLKTRTASPPGKAKAQNLHCDPDGRTQRHLPDHSQKTSLHI
jgi:hypothetical protein